jgi:FkbM family methyltransferase
MGIELEMNKLIIKMIKRAFRAAGIDVRRWSLQSSVELQLQKILQHTEIDLVLDVGADTGQFALGIRNAGYRGTIVSFEPLTSAHRLLVTEARCDSNWIIYERCALGAEAGEIEINVSENMVSSSILPILDSHISAAPLSRYQGKESVPLVTLNSAAKKYIEGKKNILLKIDTQGYEWEVLNGASDIMLNITAALMELSLVSLYEGGKLWSEVISRMESYGFELWNIQSGFTDPRNGRTLQVDGIFIAKKKILSIFSESK